MLYDRFATQNPDIAGRPHPFGHSKKTTLVFIDGENLFSSAKDVSARQRETDWNVFLAALLGKDEELVRVYWCRPQEIPEDRVPAPASAQAMKKYTAPKLRHYEEVSIEYPVVESIRRVHVMRLSSDRLPTNRNVARTLKIADKLINVYESQIELAH